MIRGDAPASYKCIFHGIHPFGIGSLFRLCHARGGLSIKITLLHLFVLGFARIFNYIVVHYSEHKRIP